jgi:hypothetical protein
VAEPAASSAVTRGMRVLGQRVMCGHLVARTLSGAVGAPASARHTTCGFLEVFSLSWPRACAQGCGIAALCSVMCWGASAGVGAAFACSGRPVDAEKVPTQLKIAFKTKHRGQNYNQSVSFLPWTRPPAPPSSLNSELIGQLVGPAGLQGRPEGRKRRAGSCRSWHSRCCAR